MIYLIVPCYNEENRLPVNEFKKYKNPQCQLLFVNDGSSDNTSQVLTDLCADTGYERLILQKNQGKAEAVRLGVQHLLKTKKLCTEDWIGFWDADLSTPLFEIENFITYLSIYKNQNIEAIFGSRVYRLGAKIKRKLLRHYIGRAFATVMRIIFKIESYDSQCGAKLFSYKMAEKVFASPFVSRWIFDVEILLRSDDSQIIEYPVRQWIDVDGSKITIKETFRIISDILKVYWAY